MGRIPPTSPFTAAFLLFDGFSNMVLSHAMEPLRAAAAIAGTDAFDWWTCTLDGGVATSSSGLRVAVDGALADLPDRTDLLAIVAGYDFDALAGPDLLAQLRQVSGRVARIMGCDTGAWVLAEAGMLSGRRATIHWHETDRFAETFPDIDVLTRDFVVEGDHITTGSAEGTLAVMLELVAARTDAHVQQEVERLFGPWRTDETSMGLLLPARLRTVLRHIDVKIEDRLTVAGLARDHGLSRRALERMFHDGLGTSPAAYVRWQRLLRADRLARDSQLSVQEIAVRCGFSSAPVLGRAFRQAFGTSIRARRAGARPDDGAAQSPDPAGE
ncbi:GlxA family transcriptional regulator [Jannaschia rubra]|uniref:GlxA family transcriptional regulator n=1 Tax=Jannaschia rubra TaxID=282197 RepID=UPI00248FE31C|nr:helix-turn-helix domain-containing protein [Jannaschia rubra]